jgi:hypothetical protein
MKQVMLRFLAVIVFLLFVTSLVLAPWPVIPGHPVVSTVTIAFFGVPCVGAIWMMYLAIRFEAAPLLYVGLALVPFSFIWFYFKRFRTRQYLSRSRHGR